MEIGIEYIKPGMILKDNVYTGDGNLLMPKKTELTEQAIIKLISFGVYKVTVEGNLDRNDEMHIIKQEYDNTLDRVRSTFNQLRYKKVVQISEFKNIVDSIVNQLLDNYNILTYMKMIGQKDEYTLQHSINVAILAMLMGKWLNYKTADINRLGLSAILHDIGKIMIPDSILNKPGKLTEDEYDVIKKHTIFGYQILKNSHIDDDLIMNVVLTHHERENGRGYPFGLAGDSINENTKIVSISDEYDAITSERVYKKKENPLKGFQLIIKDTFNGINPYLADIFIRNSSQIYYGSNAVLSDGREGKILKIPPDDPLNPWITMGNELLDLKSCTNLEIIDIK